MSSSQNIILKQGQLFVDFSEVYLITKVVDPTPNPTPVNSVIYYKPVFADNIESSLIFSENQQSFQSSYKRPLLTKAQIKKILADLKSGPSQTFDLDTDAVSEAVKLSDLSLIIEVVKGLWHQKHQEELTLTSNQNDLLETLLTYLSQEFSVVLESTPALARKKILTSLNR